MTPDETRLAAALVLAAPGAVALAALFPRWTPWRLACSLAALAGAVAALLLAYLRWSERLPADVSLLTWSPLGLYGATLALRLQPDALLLMLPALALTVLGAARRRPAHRFGSAAGDAFALVTIAGALLVCVAGDLLSLFFAVALYLAAGAALLWCVAGARPAAGRAMAACAAGIGLLVCVLVLGEVNGHFDLAQLSTAGFTAAPFAGVLLAALVAAPVPPFHGWLLRVARQPLAPALGAAGGAVCLALLLTTFQVTAGQFAFPWQRWLGALAWCCALVTAGVALTRGAAPVRFAALFAGRGALTLLAASVATPASMAAAVLYFLLTDPLTALLWLVVRVTPAGTRRPITRAAAPARRPGFWLFALLLAGAAGLPGTAGGLAGNALVGALTSWPSGDQWHRVPPLLLDAATLVAGGSLLWRRPWFPRLRGVAGWMVVAIAGAALAAPVALPMRLVGSWFGPAAALAAGTAGSPLALAVSPAPTFFSALLGLLALWALVQCLRGGEWLPAPARAVIGAAALGWMVVQYEAHRRELGNAPARIAGATLRRLEAVAGRAAGFLRPIEERYYAAATVMLAVALIYIIAR